MRHQSTMTSREQDDIDQAISSLLLRPAEVLARHLVELLIERSEEVPQPLQDLLVYVRVLATLRLAEAVRTAAALGLLQTWETFRRVEVEVFVGDDTLEAQEPLNLRHLAGRIAANTIEQMPWLMTSKTHSRTILL